MGTVTLAARMLLVVVFGTAAVTKLSNASASRDTLREFGAGDRASRIGALLLAPTELVIAIALLLVPTARWGAAGAALLLLVFIAGIGNALRQGRTPDCGCFGGLRPTPIGRSTLARNGALLAAAVFAALAGPGPAVDGWLNARSTVQLSVTAAVVAAAAAAYAAALRTGAVAPASLARPTPVPPVGQPAPPFQLPGACGPEQTLSALCSSGLPILLVFGNPGCGGCLGLFPHLRRWQSTLTDRLRITVIGIGEPNATRELCRDFGLSDVLIDSDTSVWRAYGMQGNPAAFALAPDGTLAGGPAVGQDAIEDLIRLTLHRDEPMGDLWSPTTRAA